VDRLITGFRRDADGDWIAELGCGHDQHVRHRPPFQPREWILTPEGRAERLRTPLSCRLCDQAELPPTARPVRSSAVWNERTVPRALRRSHRLAAGTWGLLIVHEGRLRCHLATEPRIDVVLTPARAQPLPPEVDHEVAPDGAVRFSIEFLAVDRHRSRRASSGASTEQGGDPACWAGLLCPECGAVPSPSGDHRPGCPNAGPTRGLA
jgi:tellurite methyltransferase